jgi:hypothetical protein
MLTAIEFLKFGNKLYTTRVMPEDATFAGTRVNLSGTGAAFISPYTLEDLPSENPDDFGEDILVLNDPLWIIASSRGTWGNNVRVAIINRTEQQKILRGTSTWSSSGANDTKALFTSIDSPLDSEKDFLVVVEVKEQGKNRYEIKEIFNVSTDVKAVDDQGITKYVENAINTNSRYIRVALWDEMKDGVWSVSTPQYINLESGTDGEETVSDADVIKALELYKNSEEIDVNMFIDGDKSLIVKKKMIEICENRKDCMAILDCPYELVVNNKGNEVTDLVNWRLGLGTFSENNLNENTSYASLYGNWAEVYNKYLKKYQWIPMSGIAAGIYAKTDDVSDPWFAPAGLNRAIVTGTRRIGFNPDLGKRDILYMNGINPVCSFAGQGKVLWGQKTLLDKSSAFNRVNVRRLFMVLEKAISTAAKYFLFEPNDAVTRSLLTNMIVPFLRDVQARRGIYEFKVVCDETINTPERIDRNELWCNIFIKPTRAAEFIRLNFVATKTGASFEEVAAAVA